MTSETFLNDRVTLHPGDCLDVLARLEDASIDSVVTDPPYHLTSIVKRFGGKNAAPAKAGKTGAYKRASAGFMGKQWDGGDIAFRVELWAQVLRVLKPGGHILAFSGTRTYHRMVCAIEDAGFEIRDQIGWAFGSGFPKSHDVSKGIDKLDAVDVRLARRYQFTEWFVSACPLNGRQMDEVCLTNTMGRHWTDCRPSGKQPDIPTREYFELLRPYVRGDVPPWVEAAVDERTVESENFKAREVVALIEGTRLAVAPGQGEDRSDKELAITVAHSPEAREWQGWGTALKPAWEPIVLARKPLRGTVADNVIEHGTGAINIAACRVGEDVRSASFTSFAPCSGNALGQAGTAEARRGTQGDPKEYVGRWPANIINDGSEEVVKTFPDVNTSKSVVTSKPGSVYGNGAGLPSHTGEYGFDESGSAARFFYSAKADSDDRLGSKHPTVKPLDLMQWLARLITPKGGTVLDPFAGTGTTGEAAWREGFSAILIERETEYQDDIRRRMGLCLSGPDERARESIKAKTKDMPIDAGPLFGGSEEVRGGRAIYGHFADQDER